MVGKWHGGAGGGVGAGQDEPHEVHVLEWPTHCPLQVAVMSVVHFPLLEQNEHDTEPKSPPVWSTHALQSFFAVHDASDSCAQQLSTTMVAKMLRSMSAVPR